MIIKDASKKWIVDAYQLQLQESIDKVKALEEKPNLSQREYIKVMEGNYENAPYILGYLQFPEIEEKKEKKKK